MHYISVGIDLKELGGQMSKCLKFCQGLKCTAEFHSKMSVCRHELGVVQPQSPGNSNPALYSFSGCTVRKFTYSTYEFFMCLVPQTVRSASVSQTFPRVQ